MTLDPTSHSPPKPQLEVDVELIPWDTSSPDHIQRLVQQRYACGWDFEDAVARWKTAQEEGRLNLQWVVLAPSPTTSSLLHTHTRAHPLESLPLTDTAQTFGSQPRTPPSPPRTFIPIGHICLGSPSPEYISLNYVTAEPGLYWISNFYISRALQGKRLGSLVLDMVEGQAMKEPLNARVLALNAIDKVDGERVEKYAALKMPIPLFSNQEWYERRGYQRYKDVPKLFSKIDNTGKEWYFNAVFLKKDI